MVDSETLARLPMDAGVYLFYDERDVVIYVGKAKNLRARVRQYFRANGDDRFFVAAGLLSAAAVRVETMVVPGEKEALLLENHLIKQHQPRFNIKLRDDKQYLVMRLSPAREGSLRTRFPRVEVVRHIAPDEASYYGPYHSATSARETLRVLNRHFQLRTCTDHVLEHRGRPCLQYQIKRCPAPCALPIESASYMEQLADVDLFLRGRDRQLLARLAERMQQRVHEERFEDAARLRDSIADVKRTISRQVVVQDSEVDQDVWGIARRADVAVMAVLFVRSGKLIGRRVFHQRREERASTAVLGDLLQQYYAGGAVIPSEVLVPCELEAAQGMEAWLTEQAKGRVSLRLPQRGTRHELLTMAEKNADAELAQRHEEHELAELLHDRLRLTKVPRRIECFDIAHHQGDDTVASMVVFVDGEPVRAAYRRFVVRTVANDDFGAMREILRRRAARLGQAGWEQPDLIVIDGGKGQLAMALVALRDLGVAVGSPDGVDVVSLAKERAARAVVDRVFVPGIKDAINLRANTPELFVLARLRDEAHRFANTFHRERRSRRVISSALDDAPGIGPKRRAKLLSTFGSVAALQRADAVAVAKIGGVSLAVARAVLAHVAGVDVAHSLDTSRSDDGDEDDG